MLQIFEKGPGAAVADARVQSKDAVSDVHRLVVGPDRSHRWNDIHTADVTGAHPFSKLDIFPTFSRPSPHDATVRCTHFQYNLASFRRLDSWRRLWCCGFARYFWEIGTFGTFGTGALWFSYVLNSRHISGSDVVVSI